MKKEVINIAIVKEAPYKLTDEGSEIWNKFWQSKAEEIEILTIDYFNLAAYCEEMALYYRCRMFVRKNGLTYSPNKKSQAYKVQYPEVSIGNKAFANAQSLCAKLGLSPLDRKKLNMGTNVKSKDDSSDPFADVV